MPPESHSEVFTCWKEIASYLGKGVRTVQRWEQELGLPVRRPEGSDNPNKILAIRSEVDAWRSSRWTKRRPGAATELGLSDVRAEVQKLKELCQKHREVGYSFLVSQIELATTFIAIAWNAPESRRRANIAIAEKAYQNVARLRSSLRLDSDRKDELTIKLSFLELSLSQLSRHNPNNLREAIVNLEYLMKVTSGPILREKYNAKLAEYRSRLEGPLAIVN